MDQMIRKAEFSPCGQYRYTLTRSWDSDAIQALWILLNPSKADAKVDDATVRKLNGFSFRMGFGGYTLANMFAFCATDPEDLRKARKAGTDIVGAANNLHLDRLLSTHEHVICAWGGRANISIRRTAEVVLKVKQSGRYAKCLGRSKHGHPLHPLYLSYTSRLAPYVPPPNVGIEMDRIRSGR